MCSIVHVRPRSHIPPIFSYIFGNCFLNILIRLYETRFDVLRFLNIDKGLICFNQQPPLITVFFHPSHALTGAPRISVRAFGGVAPLLLDVRAESVN